MGASASAGPSIMISSTSTTFDNLSSAPEQVISAMILAFLCNVYVNLAI